jgi:hypothetical protein
MPKPIDTSTRLSTPLAQRIDAQIVNLIRSQVVAVNPKTQEPEEADDFGIHCAIDHRIAHLPGVPE